MMKILLTGGSGLFGVNFILSAPKGHEIYATFKSHQIKAANFTAFRMDITDQGEAAKIITSISPDVVIHAAALTDVNYCEQKKSEAHRINVEGTGNVLAASEKSGAKLVYISTDSVFEGTKGNYKETDATNPVNYYGIAKLEGENLVKNYENSLIIRTNLYGWNTARKTEFSEWIISSLESNKRIPLFTDIYFTPMTVTNLIRVMLELIVKKKRGVYHVAGSQRSSRLEFGLALADIFGLDKGLIDPVKFSSQNSMAPRPVDPSLNVSKASNAVKEKLLGLREGLEEMKGLRNSGYVKKLKSL